MDCILCHKCGIIYYELDHPCFLKEKFNDEGFELDHDKLNQYAAKLKKDKTNQECSRDGLGHSNTEIKQMVCNDLKLNSSLESDGKFSELKQLEEYGPFITTSSTFLNIPSDGNLLDIPPSDHNVVAERSVCERLEQNTSSSLDSPARINLSESSQVVLTPNQERERDQLEHFSEEKEYQRSDSRSTSRESNETFCPEVSFSKNSTKDSGFSDTTERKSFHLDTKNHPGLNNFQGPSYSALGCAEGKKYKAPKSKDSRKSSLKLKDNSRKKCNKDDKRPISVTHADAVSVAGPSGINTKSWMSDKENPFKCEKCNKILSSKYNLQVHRITHTGEKLFLCHICGKMFSQNHNLNTHILTHTGTKQFACNVCGKGFITKQQFRLHTMTHTGEKLFLCHICGKMFSQNHNLNTHILTHTGTKQFACNVCGKGFITKQHFQVHTMTHTGEKPFKCAKCGVGFSTRYNCNKHYKLKHQETFL